MRWFLVSIVLLVASTASAQVVEIPITFTDSVHPRELAFGLDPTATDGLDLYLLEVQFPPLPPGLFEALFTGENIGLGSTFGNGTMRDFRSGDLNFSGSVSHEVKLRQGVGTQVTVEHNLPVGVTVFLEDLAATFTQTLTGTGSFTLPSFPPRVLLTVVYAFAPGFQRGDANGDGSFNIADAVFTLDQLFGSSMAPTCDDAVDANDDGSVNLADAVYTLNALFVVGANAPPDPHVTCGSDPTADMLDCTGPTGC